MTAAPAAAETYRWWVSIRNDYGHDAIGYVYATDEAAAVRAARETWSILDDEQVTAERDMP